MVVLHFLLQRGWLFYFFNNFLRKTRCWWFSTLTHSLGRSKCFPHKLGSQRGRGSLLNFQVCNYFVILPIFSSVSDYFFPSCLLLIFLINNLLLCDLFTFYYIFCWNMGSSIARKSRTLSPCRQYLTRFHYFGQSFPFRKLGARILILFTYRSRLSHIFCLLHTWYRIINAYFLTKSRWFLRRSLSWGRPL